MSSPHPDRRRPRRRPDDGFTLIELVVVVFVLGVLMAVIAAAVTTVFRSAPVAESRVETARWEQALALWLPPDLASATTVSDDPGYPCGEPTCTVLTLTWEGVEVSYRYGPDPSNDDGTYVLTRVECRAGSCRSHIILRDLAPPIDGQAPIRIDPDLPPGGVSGERVEVTVSVGGTPGGEPRNSEVKITAGGVVRTDLPLDPWAPPSFEAPSACGGAVTLVVDTSGSVRPGMADIKAGVKSFVNELSGTSTRLQIVTFANQASTLGTAGWNRYFDLSDVAPGGDVDELVRPGGLVDSLDGNGRTNYEDALFRTFYTQDGTAYGTLDDPLRPAPGLVVFFTDGMVSWMNDSSPVEPETVPSRFDHQTAGNGEYGLDFSPRGWYRADHVLDQQRANARVIGVGVGPDFDEFTNVSALAEWDTSPIPNRNLLGDLIANNDPSDSTSSGSAKIVEYDGTWTGVSTADLLVTDDFANFGGALRSIANDVCGGTLTVQARHSGGARVDAALQYQATYDSGEGPTTTSFTTSRLERTATRDIGIASGFEVDVTLEPVSLQTHGFAVESWECRSRGVVMAGSTGPDVEVEVTTESAVSCTMVVTSG